MDLECHVVAKKDNKWFIGKIEGFEFTAYKEIKRLSDVKDMSSYISLKKYLDNNKKSPSLVKVILRETGLKSIYILNNPMTEMEEVSEWNKHWWKKYNSECMKCVKDCKQSYLADVWLCKDFEERMT